MKKTSVFLFAALTAFLTAVASPTESVIRLLNSRAATSPLVYLEAAREVAEYAQSNPKAHLHRYVIALFSEDPILKKNLGIPDDVLRGFLVTSGSEIRRLADNVDDEESGNALAWYLWSVEEMNEYERLQKVNNPGANAKLKSAENKMKRAAKGNNVQALSAYGTFLLNRALTSPTITENEFEKMTKECFSMFSIAAAMKDANGHYNLGICYIHGFGCEKNMESAYDCFRAAAKLGHPGAFNNLGGFFRDGVIGEKSYENAFKMFNRSHELGNSYGTLNIAFAYQRGEGVEKNLERAAELFRMSAMDGNPEAKSAYGLCLYRGEGVAENPVEAVKWFKSAAKDGYAPAMDNLAICFAEGKGVYGNRKSEQESLVWRIRARAARGDRNAVVWLTKNGHELR